MVGILTAFLNQLWCVKKSNYVDKKLLTKTKIMNLLYVVFSANFFQGLCIVLFYTFDTQEIVFSNRLVDCAQLCLF